MCCMNVSLCARASASIALTDKFGTALSIASMEINGKVAVMRSRLDELNAKIEEKTLEAVPAGVTPAPTLQFIVLEEVRGAV